MGLGLLKYEYVNMNIGISKWDYVKENNIKILTYDFVQKPQKKVALFMGHPVQHTYISTC